MEGFAELGRSRHSVAYFQRCVAVHLGFHYNGIAQNIAVYALNTARMRSVKAFRNSQHNAELFNNL